LRHRLAYYELQILFLSQLILQLIAVGTVTNNRYVCLINILNQAVTISL
ncbi:MAG: hypothetical protein ACJA0M_002573, partial [Chitinophagales bacterium]